MVINLADSELLFLGIDGGGSKCKAIIVDAAGVILGSGIAGPANPFHGFDQAVDSIVESAKLALNDAGLSVAVMADLVVGMGLAGVNLPSLYQAMLQWQHPFKMMFLTTDLHIACLGAHAGKDGAILIAGTGSCGYRSVNSATKIVGGHGFPHGDQGSGAWLGFQAVSKVLVSLDGIGHESLMNKMMLTHLSCDNDLALVELVANKPASFFGQLAFIVFDAAEQQDQTALDIINVGSGYINDVVCKLQSDPVIRMSLIGGLASKLLPWLTPEVQQWLQAPINPPEIGAVLYAKQQIKN